MLEINNIIKERFLNNNIKYRYSFILSYINFRNYFYIYNLDKINYSYYSTTFNTKNVLLYHNNLGKLHRYGDLPSIIKLNGNQYYYKNGKKHRDNNKPAVVTLKGKNEYWINGNKINIKR